MEGEQGMGGGNPRAHLAQSFHFPQWVENSANLNIVLQSKRLEQKEGDRLLRLAFLCFLFLLLLPQLGRREKAPFLPALKGAAPGGSFGETGEAAVWCSGYSR